MTIKNWDETVSPQTLSLSLFLPFALTCMQLVHSFIFSFSLSHSLFRDRKIAAKNYFILLAQRVRVNIYAMYMEDIILLTFDYKDLPAR